MRFLRRFSPIVMGRGLAELRWSSFVRVLRFPDSPIIIGGPPRSGTTLLLAILGAHPEIAAVPGETYAFVSPRGKAILRTRRLVNIYMGQRIARSATVSPSAKRWCEKTPLNPMHFSHIAKVFGSSFRMVSIVRDGRDVVTSIHPSRPNEYWCSVDKWVERVKVAQALNGHPQVYTIKYEDMVCDFDVSIESLCDFLGIENKVSLDWHSDTTIQSDSAWHEDVRPVHTSSLKKWNRPEHAGRVQEFMSNPEAVKLLRELGYD